MLLQAPRIQSAAAFAAEAQARPVASLYYYSVLDPIIDLAVYIAKDFICRPHIYLNLPNPGGPSIPRILGKLYAQYGTEVIALGSAQRKALYNSLFGTSILAPDRQEDGFPRLTHELLDASTAFSERVYDTGQDMLRARVRTTHRPFNQYLTKLAGDTVTWARDEALGPLTEACYIVLRSPGIAAVFGVNAPPAPEWPFVEDANGDSLLEEVAKHRVQSASMRGEEPDTSTPLTRERFSNLQRLALRGAEGISAVIIYDESLGANKTEDEQNVDMLITACYTWGAALLSMA